jgi:hypothetical protein
MAPRRKKIGRVNVSTRHRDDGSMDPGRTGCTHRESTLSSRPCLQGNRLGPLTLSPPPKNPKTVIGPQRLIHEQHANRVEEEARCRQWLVKLPWATHIADTEDNDQQSKEMNTLVRSYLQNHDTESCKRRDAGLWPTNMRLWLAEFVWCMDELHKRGLLPRILTHPNDKELRRTASEAAGPAGEDPGNVNWDTLVCLCRLWKYVDEGPFREKNAPH